MKTAPESYFPRGGKKPCIRVRKTLFGKAKKRTLKKKGAKKRGLPIKTFSLGKSLKAIKVDALRYKTVCEGMIVLGAIREVRPTYLNISLPGRLSARAPVTNISAPYVQLLKTLVRDDEQPEGYSTLNRLFERGRHVACKITEVTGAADSDSFRVTVSLAPDRIHSDLRHDGLSERMLLTAAVSSVEDHGYVMDLGVKHCRAFLPKSNAPETLHIGQPVWCEVSKIVTSNVTSTVTLNAVEKKIFKNKVEDEKSLDKLFPGMMVDFTINRVLPNGLQGTFLNKFVGYVHETQLKEPLESLNKYRDGQKLNARILYVMPTTKFTYLTLQHLKLSQNTKKDIGNILQGTVLSPVGKGLFLSLPDGDKGYVSYGRLELKGPVDRESLFKSYPVGSNHKCRIIGYEYMDRVYVCTLERKALKEKIFTVDDIKTGSVVTVVVNEILPNGIGGTVGNLSAFVQDLHLSDIPLAHRTPALKRKFQPGQKLVARVIGVNPEKGNICLTLKQSLIDTKLPCLISYDGIKKGAQFDGYIVKVTEKGLLVAFYGNVKGWVPVSRSSADTIKNPEKSFSIGQVVKCTAVYSDPSQQKLILSLTTVDSRGVTFVDRGELLSGTVSKVSATGLEVTLKKPENKIAFLPALHLTEHPSLAPVLLGTYSKGSVIDNLVCVNSDHGVPTVSLRDFQYFKAGIPCWYKLKPNTLLHCSVHEIHENSLLLLSPIKGYDRLIVVPASDIADFTVERPSDLNLQKHRSLVAKVTSVDRNTRLLNATTKLSSCWDRSLKTGIDLLTSYIVDINRIHDSWVSKKKPLVGLSLGRVVEGTVVAVKKNGFCSIRLENGIVAYAPVGHYGKNLKKNEKVNGSVMWLDYEKNLVIITVLPKYMSSISDKQDNKKLKDRTGYRLKGVILLVRSDIIVAALKGSAKGQLIVLPTRLHKNDIEPAVDTYKVGSIMKIIPYRHVGKYSIGLPRHFLKTDVELKKEISALKKQTERSCKEGLGIDDAESIIKRKRNATSSSDDGDSPKKKSKTDDCKVDIDVENIKKVGINFKKQNKNASSKKKQAETKENAQIEEEPVKKYKRKNSDGILENEKVPLSGADNFWSLEPEMLKVNKSNDFSSESDEENKEDIVEDKKKKLTKAERAEAALKEERRIREIEERLADTDAPPTSADQFDRLVISKPNSSAAWIGYMAYHLQSTEIEKARAVAKKALDTISFREEQEKLNVWIALLNLENRYGTKESFSSVLEEALRTNDALTVHTRALSMLADTGKQAELQEMLNVVVRRYKHESEAWLQAAIACFAAGLQEKARALLQRALCSVDKKQHVDLIVKFALLEAKHYETERAETLFEQVLTTYPRRVDVWIVYIDMLIKAKKVDIARKVLERSVSSKLPARKMKTLFKKFIGFEQTYGDEEKVDSVRKLAAEYVQNATE